MRTTATLLGVLGSAAAAHAEGQEKEKLWRSEKKGKDPIAQWTTTPKHPYTRPAGKHPSCHAWWAHPSLTKHYAGGYIGGGGLKKGHYPGPTDGTYGTDYLTFKDQYDKLFLKFGSGKGESFIGHYDQHGPRLPDPVAAAPFRKAVIEARHEHGSLLHHTPPKGGHGGEGGH